MSFDSTQDTMDHVSKVREHLEHVIRELTVRAALHDKSKLEELEKSAFDSLGDNLKGLTYGSDEYMAQLKKIKPALDHHYAHNRHHPEYHRNLVCIICFKEFPLDYDRQCDVCGNGEMSLEDKGINGMSLIDLIEMFCDWKAASERHNDGDIEKSIAHNKGRFAISNQLTQILANTARQLNWTS